MTSNPQTGSPLENLEDLYPLSPMQQGMLFHSILAPESSAYFEQTVFTINGELDLAAFKAAWQMVLDRHAILRSSFLWEDLEKPQQVVQRRIALPLEELDWRELDEPEQERCLKDFVSADRQRGFDLQVAPLLRLALIRTGDNTFRMLFSRHHLLLDRWSRALLLREVWEIYESLAAGREPSLSPSRPYGDFIEWLLQQDQSAAQSFWSKTLDGLTTPPVLNVATESATPATETGYASQRIQLSEPSSAALQQFAKHNQVTLNTVVQAAWGLLLIRYTGSPDVVFGVTVACRPASLPGSQTMIGLFINTLPLRLKYRPNEDPVEWLKEVQQKQLDLQQYEFCSLVDIQGWSNVPRGVPLFESIFVFENLPGGVYSGQTNLSIRTDRGIGSLTGYPLTVLVTPGERITIEVIFATARFSNDLITRLITHFQTLLEGFLAAPQRLADLPLLPKQEEERLVTAWQGEVVWETDVESVSELFIAQVKRTPDEIAVSFAGTSLSYRELNERANQLAHYLRKTGIGPEETVGICFSRGTDMGVAVLATLKTGAAYVPLDSEYPPERLRFMWENSGCRIVLGDSAASAVVPEDLVLNLSTVAEDIANESKEDFDVAVFGDNLVYVIHTSGSTGEPKSVAMTNRALVNLLRWQLHDEISFPPARTLQFASLSFDVSFQEIFSTWCSGGTLILVTNELRRDAVELLSFIEAENVERIFVPFIYLQHLAEAVAEGGSLPLSLQQIITAGEQLEITPQIKELFRLLPGCTLHNHYGPSETHVVTAYDLPTRTDTWSHLPPIGKPLFNSQGFILDSDLHLVPIGVPGELYLGGANLARGYLNRPQLTAERFVPSPYSQKAGARLYRTGDLARYQANGLIEFLGRADNQIKIRGFRVEPGEIEELLNSHPSVRQAVVAVRERAPRDRRLIAYVIRERAEQIQASNLREFLRQMLPDYMVPAEFVFLESFPLTPSGKIDRLKLPEPELFAVDDVYEEPQTELQRKMVELWSAVLRRSPLGLNAHFFELGGHSLLATQLISRIRSTFQIELPLRRLFEYPRLSDFVTLVENTQTESSQPARTMLRPIQSATDPASLLARIDELSEAEVDNLLGQLAETEND